MHEQVPNAVVFAEPITRKTFWERAWIEKAAEAIR